MVPTKINMRSLLAVVSCYAELGIRGCSVMHTPLTWWMQLDSVTTWARPLLGDTLQRQRKLIWAAKYGGRSLSCWAYADLSQLIPNMVALFLASLQHSLKKVRAKLNKPNEQLGVFCLGSLVASTFRNTYHAQLRVVSDTDIRALRFKPVNPNRLCHLRPLQKAIFQTQAEKGHIVGTLLQRGYVDNPVLREAYF